VVLVEEDGVDGIYCGYFAGLPRRKELNMCRVVKDGDAVVGRLKMGDVVAVGGKSRGLWVGLVNVKKEGGLKLTERNG